MDPDRGEEGGEPEVLEVGELGELGGEEEGGLDREVRSFGRVGGGADREERVTGWVGEALRVDSVEGRGGAVLVCEPTEGGVAGDLFGDEGGLE